MKKLRLLLIPILALGGGVLSRWHGGGFVGGSPKLLKAFLWSLPMAILAAGAWVYDDRGWKAAAIVGVLVLLWSMVFKNTGHGGGMDLAHSLKEPDGKTPETSRDPEKLEYFILWLHGKMPQFWYDFLLLAIIGFFSTLGASIAFGMINPWAALPAILGGVVGKSMGYLIGWMIYPDVSSEQTDGNFDEATEIGEALTGVWAYCGLGFSALIAIW